MRKYENVKMPRLLKILIFILTILFSHYSLVISNYVEAASSSFTTTGGGTINVNKIFTVSVSVYGDQAYNAVSANTTYTNLTFVSA